MSPVSQGQRTSGCLLGGAVGDALGAPVEFMSLSEIRSRFGPDGIGDYAPAYGRPGAITDDTQMTLFTVEGMIRAKVRADGRTGVSHLPSVVHHAYLRWLHTQGDSEPLRTAGGPDTPDGWLVAQPFLHYRRAPGNTCLSALAQSRHFGFAAVNDSKGCGGVMRIAPVGLLAMSGWSRESILEAACEIAGYSHGHPTGQLAAGHLALTIAGICHGSALRESIDAATEDVREKAGSAETVAAVEGAVNAADDGPASTETIESLGGAWVAEEALAISLYCALVARDFTDGIVLAVNHSGDSDSTGAITGNILGTILGVGAIPAPLLEGLEGRDVIEELATDFARMFVHGEVLDDEPWTSKYPGW